MSITHHLQQSLKKWAKEKKQNAAFTQNPKRYTAGQSPVFTLPNSLCPGTRCLAGNTNSELFNFFKDPCCSVIYSKRTTLLQQKGPELHRVPACWASSLCPDQVNMPPVDVDSWSPPSNCTVYELWVCEVPQDFWLQTCLQLHKLLFMFLYHCSWYPETITFLIIQSLSLFMPVWSSKHNLAAE